MLGWAYFCGEISLQSSIRWATGFRSDGARDGWSECLRQTGAIFDVHGDIPLVQWHHYETTKTKADISRYGDPDGLAERVLDQSGQQAVAIDVDRSGPPVVSA